METKYKLETPLWDLSNYRDQVYEPSEDTFFLIDAIEEDLPLIKKLNPVFLLELGCGSGVIITSLARFCKNSFSLAMDINPEACLVTENTAQLNGTSVNTIQADIIYGLKLTNLIDVLIFNPPYVPSIKGEKKELIDKAWAGGVDGRSTTDRLFPHLNELMSKRSVGYILAIEENDPVEMCGIIEKMGFEAEIVKKRTILGEKLSVIRFMKGIK